MAQYQVYINGPTVLERYDEIKTELKIIGFYEISWCVFEPRHYQHLPQDEHLSLLYKLLNRASDVEKLKGISYMIARVTELSKYMR